MTLAATLRQWRFPSPLRIGAAQLWPPTAFAAAELERLWQRLSLALEGASKPSAGSGADLSLLRALVTTFWRLEEHLNAMPESSESRTFRNRLRQLTNVLKTHQIQIYDYSGKAYDLDELWDDVVADETRKVKPVIVGMREPRIVYRGEMIQRGTPIVEDRPVEGGE